jgi:diguanylate cyclase
VAVVEEAPAEPAAKAAPNLLRQARSQLLESVSLFLLDHDLAVTGDNLLAAHSAFSGANPRLARQIASRINAGQPITQEWLDEVTCHQEMDSGEEAIERLMTKLEENLDAFAHTSRAARTATSDYSTQIERHVEELEQEQEAGQIVANLAAIARAMAERTRKVEHDMRKSEEEAKSLRLSLAKARRDADVDHLTGLPNRRAFETLLETHHREAQAAIEPLSVAFCDIDHFKRVNDTHGHDAGDRVIRTIGETLARITNENCHVARHGGEEFVMLFRGLTPAEAKRKLDDAREKMGARKLVNRKNDQPFGQITFSGGVADVFAYPDPRAALAAADEALYRAKEEGRNRINIATPAQPGD